MRDRSAAGDNVVRETVLADRYRLMSPLGRGGMGQVWEGEDERLERRVAVKLLTNDVLAGRTDPRDLARRFTREAALTAGLRHPGVPAVHDAGTYDGGLFLVMELVDGCTLGDLMAEQGELPIPWAASIGAQVAAVLAAAHERRFVHRDIKPQNIMITGDGSVKVLDFGVAAVLDQTGAPRITRTGEAIGTPAYMAPEQLRSGPATPRTDLYALGCVLYEMLAGEPVFEATSPAALMHKHLEQAPPPLVRADLPEDLNALVIRLLEKDPERRPADARATFEGLLPYVTRLTPLADIDPQGRSGAHLYARVLVRLGDGTGPVPPSPGVAAARPGTSGARIAAEERPEASGWARPDPRSTIVAGMADAGADGRGEQRPAAPPGAPGPGASGPNGPGPLDGGPVRQGAAYGPPGLGPPGPSPLGPNPAPYGPAAYGRPPHGAGPADELRYRPLHRTGGWKFVHSLWISPTLLFGMCTWISFGYIAIRHRRPLWLVFALLYLVLAITSFALVGSGPDSDVDTPQTTIGMIMVLCLWPIGFVHAMWINVTVRLRLRDEEDAARRYAPYPAAW